MRICLVLCIAVGSMAFPQVASARKILPPARNGAEASNVSCDQIQAALTSEQDALDDRKAMLAGVETQIKDLWDQLEALEYKRAELSFMIDRGTKSVEEQQQGWESSCRTSSSCEQYERMMSTLEERNRPLTTDLDEISKEVGATRAQIQNLKRRIEPVRNEYTKHQCNALVPGETSQSTISQCASLFSTWNRLQSDLNQANAAMPALQARYRNTSQALSGASSRAAVYETYLKKNCARSKSIGAAARYKSVQTKADRMHAELEALGKDISLLRRLRLN